MCVGEFGVVSWIRAWWWCNAALVWTKRHSDCRHTGCWNDGPVLRSRQNKTTAWGLGVLTYFANGCLKV